MQEMYDEYWQRMRFREEFNNLSGIPVKRWYFSEGLNEMEQVYFDTLKESESVLDIGSGTNSLKKKFHDNGYGGIYHTMDLSREFPHDFHNLDEIERVYDGILILEVIEHMRMEEFWKLLDFVDAHLAPEGKLVISTSHPRSVIPWESWDMTHIQHYPLHDLYAVFRSRGFSAECYRLWCRRARVGIVQGMRLLLRRFLCYILGIDYVDSFALILQRKVASREEATTWNDPARKVADRRDENVELPQPVC